MLSRLFRSLPLRPLLGSRLNGGNFHPLAGIATIQPEASESTTSGEGSEQTVDVEHSTQAHTPPTPVAGAGQTQTRSHPSSTSASNASSRRRRGRTVDEDSDVLDAANDPTSLLSTRDHFESFRSMINRLMHDFDDSIGDGLLHPSRNSNRPTRGRRDPWSALSDSILDSPLIGGRTRGESRDDLSPMVMDDDITGALSPTLDLLPMVARSPIRVDVESLKDKYCVTAEVPGLKPKDLKVNVDRGVLSIEGRYEDEHRDEDKDRSYLRIERTLGSVHRSLRLPEDVDQENIKAKYDHGVLKLTIPKRAIHLLPPGNVPIELDEHGHGRDRSADSASQKESNNQTQTKSKKTTK